MAARLQQNTMMMERELKRLLHSSGGVLFADVSHLKPSEYKGGEFLDADADLLGTNGVCRQRIYTMVTALLHKDEVGTSDEYVDRE